MENLKQIVGVCQEEMRAGLQAVLENSRASCKEAEGKLSAWARVGELQEEVLDSYADYVHLADEAQRMTRGENDNGGSSTPRESHARGILEASLGIEMDILMHRVRHHAIVKRFRLKWEN